MSFGRFKGGQHFNYLTKNSNRDFTKKKIEARATDNQLEQLRNNGLNFQKGAISEVKAKQILEKIASSKRD